MSNPSNPSIAQNFKAGDKLASCYTLKQILPAEGICTVWLAHDEELNKDIALHFVPDSVAADSRAMTELKQEAKRNRQLIHPRIVRVHDLVEDEKWAAISMDHVQGETLSSLQKKREKNAFNPSELAAGVSELCQTLEDAHRIDLLHRDLNPENLIATANGLMVQKFGISRVILDSLARTGQKLDGSRDIAGISPQQLDGQSPNRLDDIYSLGATVFNLLTGAPPFVDGDIAAQVHKTIPPLASERRLAKAIAGEPVPKAWDGTIAACLAKNPLDRPGSAAVAGARFAADKGTAAAVPLGAAAAAAGAVAAAAATPESGPARSEPSGTPAAGAPPPAEPEQAKTQKRPWSPGPGKPPTITEATVLSKTAVPKAGDKGEKGDAGKESPPGEPSETAADGPKKPSPTTPSGFPLRAFVEVDGGSKPPKTKSSGGLIAAGAVLVLILVVGYLVARPGGGSGNPAPANSAATSGSGADIETASAGASASAAPAESASPVPSPENAAAAATAAPAEATGAPAAAESPSTVAGLAALTGSEADQVIADKAKAVDQAKAALADAEKASKEKAAAQAAAAAAVQDLQAAIKQKNDAATAAKKAADDAAAALKQQQDSLQKAEADAADAQKAAAAKAQAADLARKAVQDAQTAATQQQTAEQQAEADAEAAAKAAADRQKAADAAAADAAAAEKARQEDARALAQAQADLGQAQTGLQEAEQARAAEKARQAAADADRIQKEREAETARLTAQAAAAAQAAADAQKALDAAKKAVADAEKAQHDAEQQAAAVRLGNVPMTSPTPQPAASAPPAAEASPATEASPAASTTSPSLTVHAINPQLKVDQALVNSLGMRFAPVGKVFFSIWLTRVQDFDAFAKATGYSGNAWRDPGFKQGPDHPVVNVSWNDANLFCLWLTQKEHNEGILTASETYRLPTDLEWSNAVGLPPESGRTPESRDMDIPDVYPWGSEWPPPSGAGNYTGEETDSDVAIKGYNDGFAWTSPVGSFNVNKFGLYDMGGNVWEWCMDWWNPEQKAKVLRGGSWYNGALKLSLLSSCRIHASADQGTDNYGFRVIIAQEVSKPRRHAGKPASSPSK